MATINVLDVADSAILVSGYNITDSTFIPVPWNWHPDDGISTWTGGTLDQSFEIGGDVYRVTFDYPEEIGLLSETEQLYFLGSGLSDENDTNGLVTSFSAYSDAGFLHFATNTPLTETEIINHLEYFENLTESALAGNDLIVIQGGGSSIVAHAGNDTVLGSNGADRIWADAGNDLIASGRGKDVVVAGSGNDTISAAAGNDSIWGQGGRDRINAGGGNDFVDGGRGNDKIKGQNGKDELYGHGGRDTLIGGKHDDFLSGGAGADKFVFAGRAGDDTISDFSDLDTLVFKNIGTDDGSTVFIHAQGDETLIDYGKGTVTLLGYSAADLSAENMVFL